VLLAFQKRTNCSLETYLVDFKTKRLALADFQKALGVAPGNMLSKRSKEFELSGLQKLHAKKKRFATKQLRTYYINKILKEEQFKKIMNNCQTYSKQRPMKPSRFQLVIISCPCPFKQSILDANYLRQYLPSQLVSFPLPCKLRLCVNCVGFNFRRL
jgi:hypothetical protein